MIEVLEHRVVTAPFFFSAQCPILFYNFVGQLCTQDDMHLSRSSHCALVGPPKIWICKFVINLRLIALNGKHIYQLNRFCLPFSTLQKQIIFS